MKRYLKIKDIKHLDKEIVYCDTEKINRISKRYDYFKEEYFLFILFDNGISHKYEIKNIEIEEVDNIYVEDILDIEELR